MARKGGLGKGLGALLAQGMEPLYDLDENQLEKESAIKAKTEETETKQKKREQEKPKKRRKSTTSRGTDSQQLPEQPEQEEPQGMRTSQEQEELKDVRTSQEQEEPKDVRTSQEQEELKDVRTSQEQEELKDVRTSQEQGDGTDPQELEVRAEETTRHESQERTEQPIHGEPQVQEEQPMQEEPEHQVDGQHRREFRNQGEQHVSEETQGEPEQLGQMGAQRVAEAVDSVTTQESVDTARDEKTESPSGAIQEDIEQTTSRERENSESAIAQKEVKPETVAEEVLNRLVTVSLDQIEPNPDQPRKSFPAEALSDLAASIRTYGILQPIVVEPYTREGHAPYRIIAGERRYRAAIEAGFREVPVVVRTDLPEQTAILSVVENVQRQDLTPVEEAVAYQEIMDQRHMTQQELAFALGKSRPYVANTVRLLQLDEATLAALRDGRLTSSQGRTLLAEKNLKKRAAYRRLLLEGKSSVSDVEHKRKTPTKNEYLDAAEAEMSEALGTSVSIVPRRRGWSVQIQCFTEADLEALLLRLKGEE
ncbi:MAG: ParB/RepB/Spo0J family partition protein [Peptoniphilaceae bacterium]|nr:ParB/RepB/Spo0J family partition protein [Peptoniphilaceae bacterium]